MNINKKNGQSGAALIEFVLVVPLLLLFLFGIIEFSVILYDKAVITGASREGSREWIEYKDVPVTKATLDNIIDNYTLDRLISLGPGSTPPTKKYKINDADWVAQTIGSGDKLAVEVTYTYNFLFLPAFIEGFLPSVTLSADTKMMAE
ncbi:MAG: pilus assembly protein [Desulfuromonadales bacterium]|nr:pilus assembly protein [Desulfuromonadales bacterium]